MVIFWLELRLNNEGVEKESEILPWHQYSIHTTKPAMLISLVNLIIPFSIAKRTYTEFYPSALNLFSCSLLFVFNCARNPTGKISRTNHNKTFFFPNHAKDF